MKIFANLAALVAASALASAPALALAQVTPPQVTAINSGDLFQDIPNGFVYPTNVYASALQIRGWIQGGNVIRAMEKPALTGCVTGGGTITGSDSSFYITGGSTASTSCVATFTTAYNARPICTVSSETAPGTTTPSYTVSTTAVTITQASGSSNVYDVVCQSQPTG